MKTRFFLFFLIFPIFVFAKHIEFMGIPLNGTINAFSTKLIQKGFKIDKTSSSLEVGVRMYKGVFYGKKCTLFVYYLPSTKTVYRTKICVDFSTESNSIDFMKEIISGLNVKYGEGNLYEGTHDGYISWSKIIYEKSKNMQSSDLDTYIDLGEIDVFMTQNDILLRMSYLDEFTVHIDYIDYENHEKFRNSKLKDL